jgi:hypothetical protein
LGEEKMSYEDFEVLDHAELVRLAEMLYKKVDEQWFTIRELKEQLQK